MSGISKNTVFIFVLLIQSAYLFGQTNYSWWNHKHDWDGISHWSKYMILSPGYLGPNALPVPDMNTGRLTSDARFELGVEGHYSEGDRTANIYTDLYVPLFSDRVSFQISYRPIEIYKTDTLTRDIRRSREYEPSGFSYGDIYTSTLIQIIRDHTYLPDLTISANIKTASGTNLEGARFTDTPGYWFDATLGKDFRINNSSLEYIRIYGKGGFYVYQTFDDLHFQNDAILYGAGIGFGLENLSIQNQLTGFHGYFNNGDRPVVYRLIIEGNSSSSLTYKVLFQQGLHDYSYTTLRISIMLNLNTIIAKFNP